MLLLKELLAYRSNYKYPSVFKNDKFLKGDCVGIGKSYYGSFRMGIPLSY